MGALLLLGACRSPGEEPPPTPEDTDVVPIPDPVDTSPTDPVCPPPTDLDRDGYQSPMDGGSDCDDRDAAVHPGADEPADTLRDLDCDGRLGPPPDPEPCAPTGPEDCDGLDDDCDGRVDDPWTLAVEASPAVSAVGALLDGGAAALVLGVAGESASTDGHVDVYDLDGALVVRIEGTGQSPTFGTQLATGRDLDGDGLVDLVVAAPYAVTDRGPNTGRVFVIPGPLGPHTTLDDATWIFEGGDYAGQPGGQLALLPDLDGDGLAELFVGYYRMVLGFSGPGAPFASARAPRGRAPPPPSRAADTTDTTDTTDTAAPPDPRVHRAADAFFTAEWNTGGGAWHLAAAPDHDGDGLPELLLGMPTVSSGAGLVARYDAVGHDAYTYAGDAAWSVAGAAGEGLGDQLLVLDGAVWTLSAGAPARLDEDGLRTPLHAAARRLAPAGDLDRDGRADLALEGEAGLSLLSPDGTPLGGWSGAWTVQGDRAGLPPADLDGDGLGDLPLFGGGLAGVLGSAWYLLPSCNPDEDRLGAAEGDCDDTRADVSPLDAWDLCDGVDNNCDGRVDEPAATPFAPRARQVRALGDLDGDHTLEFALLTQDGAVEAWDAEPGAEARFTITGARTDHAHAFAGAGDTDGNGFRELLVAGAEAAWLLPAGEDGEAAARATTTFADGTRWTLEGSLGNGGDLDGDGLDDPWLVGLDPTGSRALLSFAGGALPEAASLDDAAWILTLPESWDAVETPEALPGRPLDLDGDGRADLLVANPRAAYGGGRASFVLGPEPGEHPLDEVADLALYGEPGEAMGTTLAVGDLDGDGVGDAVLGGAGALRVVHGGACPLPLPARAALSVETLALADTDGDGRAEVWSGDDDAALPGGVAGGLLWRWVPGDEPTVEAAGPTAGAGWAGLVVAVGDGDGAPGEELVLTTASETLRLGRACP